MSKYTTELRYICEKANNLDTSKGYSDVNTIIENARSKIFNFDYPIFDETYKPVLEKKIIKHYYTREIGEETVGLWQLRLDARMNEIMPYFNKLYESELLHFEPFADVDYTVSHQGRGTNTGTNNVETIGSRTNTQNESIQKTGQNEKVLNLTETFDQDIMNTKTLDLTDKKTGNEKIENEKEGTVVTDNNRTEETEMKNSTTEDNTIRDTRTDDLTETTANDTTSDKSLKDTGTETTVDDKEHSKTISEDIDENNHDDRTLNLTNETRSNEEITTTYDKTTEHNLDEMIEHTHQILVDPITGIGMQTTFTHGKKTEYGDTKWDLNSDTPQGGIENLENVPPAMLYMNNANRVTDNSTTENSGKDIENKVGSESNTTRTRHLNDLDHVNSDKETGTVKNATTGGPTVTNTGTDKLATTKDITKETSEDGTEDNTSTLTLNTVHTTHESIDNDVVKKNTGTQIHAIVEDKEGTNNTDTTVTIGDDTTVTSNEGSTTDKFYNDELKKTGTDRDVGSNESTKKNTGTDTENITESIANNTTGNEAVNETKNNTLNLANTDDWITHYVGKTPGKSFYQVLQEMRESFLNIDMMVIDSLNDLFMLVW